MATFSGRIGYFLLTRGVQLMSLFHKMGKESVIRQVSGIRDAAVAFRNSIERDDTHSERLKIVAEYAVRVDLF
jgi:hypothetical protein